MAQFGIGMVPITKQTVYETIDCARGGYMIPSCSGHSSALFKNSGVQCINILLCAYLNQSDFHVVSYCKVLQSIK